MGTFSGDHSPDSIRWSFALTADLVFPGEKPHEIDAGSETADKSVSRVEDFQQSFVRQTS